MSSIGIVDDITDAYLVVYLALEDRKNLVPIVFYLGIVLLSTQPRQTQWRR